jgi:hypothetical protein
MTVDEWKKKNAYTYAKHCADCFWCYRADNGESASPLSFCLLAFRETGRPVHVQSNVWGCVRFHRVKSVWYDVYIHCTRVLDMQYVTGRVITGNKKHLMSGDTWVPEGELNAVQA